MGITYSSLFCDARPAILPMNDYKPHSLETILIDNKCVIFSSLKARKILRYDIFIIFTMKMSTLHR